MAKHSFPREFAGLKSGYQDIDVVMRREVHPTSKQVRIRQSQRNVGKCFDRALRVVMKDAFGPLALAVCDDMKQRASTWVCQQLG